MTLLDFLNISAPSLTFDVGKEGSGTVRIHGTTTSLLMFLSETVLQSKVTSVNSSALDEIVVDLDLLGGK